jgi:hypothetical protein
MNLDEIIKEALTLKVCDRYLLVEILQKSLSKPDAENERMWIEEAQHRLLAYREGKVKGIPMSEIFKNL